MISDIPWMNNRSRMRLPDVVTVSLCFGLFQKVSGTVKYQPKG